MKLPAVSANEMLKILMNKKGFTVTRQRGSHISLHKKTEERTLLVVVPQKREIKKGTLLSILRQAKISQEEFLELIGMI